MNEHLIPLMTTEVFRKLPDQATELINRLVYEANENKLAMAELTNEIIVLKQQVADLQPTPPTPPTPTGDWVQVLAFDVTRMGTTPGLCLGNVQLGYGFEYGDYNSAREDMNAQIANGTLHAELPPADVAVPIYYNNSMAAGHVAVSDHGIIYSDGVMYGSIDAVTSGYRGWGELVGGHRVVAPAP